MNIRLKVRLALVGILILAAAAAVVDYPKGPNLKFGGRTETKVHLGLDLQGGTSLLYEADVNALDSAERDAAMESVRDVIERRINAFGVAEPGIQTIRSGDAWRVQVELPGVTDITEAIDRIGETPLLEFKIEGPPPEFSEEQKEEIRQKNEESKQKAEEVLQKALAADADFSGLATEFSEDPGSKDKGGDLGEFGRGEMVPEFDEVVFNKAEVGKVYPELVKSDFGYHIIKVDERTKPENNNDTEANNAANENTSDVATTKAKAHHILIRTMPEKPPIQGPFYRDVVLTGEQLERANVTFDPNTGMPTVSLEFNSEGQEKFAQITRDNVSKTIAIYLDGQIISAPVVQQEIPNGEAVITGNFTLEEAKEMVRRLNAGALPVPIKLISQQNVGPTLGQESVERSFFAGLIGLVALAIFMIIYYRLPGLISIIALSIYALFVLMIFKLWPITLTLAGIAGFILSVGMAVDANVLIFERFKEELRDGKPLNQSIDDGFKRAWSSIRDSNTSSLITCLILYWFGSSLIRGFAVTLAVGILVSMFSAITISRNLLRQLQLRSLWWYGLKRQRNSNQSS